MLKTRKWTELKSRGCDHFDDDPEFTEVIDAVMAGKTACIHSGERTI